MCPNVPGRVLEWSITAKQAATTVHVHGAFACLLVAGSFKHRAPGPPCVKQAKQVPSSQVAHDARGLDWRCSSADRNEDQLLLRRDAGPSLAQPPLAAPPGPLTGLTGPPS
jgi:hypothetical protein